MASRVGRDIVTQPPLPLPKRGGRSTEVAGRSAEVAVNLRSRPQYPIRPMHPARGWRFAAAVVVPAR